MKRNVSLSVFVALLSSTMAAAEVPEVRDIAMSSTNYWAVDLAEYRTRIAESIPWLATNRTNEARDALKDWYVSLAEASCPTSSVSLFEAWSEEQASSLSAYSRFLLDISCTNAWMSAAQCMGRLQDGIDEFAVRRQSLRERMFVNGLLTDVENAKEALAGEQELLFARQRTMNALSYPIVEIFGCRGIPSLPVGERMAFVSNFVSLARLPLTEADKINRACNKE